MINIYLKILKLYETFEIKNNSNQNSLKIYFVKIKIIKFSYFLKIETEPQYWCLIINYERFYFVANF